MTRPTGILLFRSQLMQLSAKNISRTLATFWMKFFVTLVKGSLTVKGRTTCTPEYHKYIAVTKTSF